MVNVSCWPFADLPILPANVCFLEVLRKRLYRVRIKAAAAIWEPRRGLSVKGAAGTSSCGGMDMRTFVAGETKIDVIAHISQEDLELDRLVLSRFEGSEMIANAAFQRSSIATAAGPWPSMPWRHKRSISTDRIPACLLPDALRALLPAPSLRVE